MHSKAHRGGADSANKGGASRPTWYKTLAIGQGMGVLLDVPRQETKRYFQDPLFDEFRSDTCYVCCKSIAPNKGICVGQGLWRHEGCKPGSRKWSQSSIESRHARTGKS